MEDYIRYIDPDSEDRMHVSFQIQGSKAYPQKAEEHYQATKKFELFYESVQSKKKGKSRQKDSMVPYEDLKEKYRLLYQQLQDSSDDSAQENKSMLDDMFHYNNNRKGEILVTTLEEVRNLGILEPLSGRSMSYVLKIHCNIYIYILTM